MESFRQDVRLAIRLLVKQRGFSLLAISTLALGIGLSTALFSILDAAFIRPLPYPNPEQLVSVWVQELAEGGERGRMDPSRQDIDDMLAGHAAFTHLALSSRALFEPLVVEAAEPVKVTADRVTRDYFAMLGVQPSLGRAFTDDDFTSGEPVVILGHGFWHTHFGGDRDIVGRTVRISDKPATVVGVLPEWFFAERDLWRPLLATDRDYTRRGRGIDVDARLRPGVTIEQAETALSAVMRRAAESRGGSPVAVRLLSTYDSVTSDNVATARTIAWSVSLLLLLACINVSGLLLARGSQRAPELAVRASLGASRAGLIRQLLTEGLVLALAAAVIGVGVAWLSLDALTAYLPFSLPDNAPLAINVRVLAFALAATMATSLVFGLVPALRLSRTNIAGMASRTGRSGSALSDRGGQILIFAEVALAVVLLCGTGLMIRSMSRVLAVDLGFAAASFRTIDVSPASSDRQRRSEFYPALLEALAAHPMVESAAAVDHVPLMGMSTSTFARVDGKQYQTNIRRYLGAYFDVAGFRVKAGVLPAPLRAGSGPPPIVVNDTAVTRMFGGANPIGRRITVSRTTGEVVAVVQDIRFWGPVHSREARADVYVPAYAATTPPNLTVIARPRPGASITREVIRAAASSTGQRAAIQEIRHGRDWYSDHLIPVLSPAVLFGILGAAGFVLALVGVFGMTAYAVSRRTRDIGVRVALGADPRAVAAAILARAAVPAFGGVAAGLVAAWWATRVIQSFLFDTETRDMPTFVAVAVTLVVAALVAAWIPARRAARVDPIVALRAE